jgi:transposase
MRPHGTPNELAQRRRRALALLEQGLAPVTVAQRLGVDRRSVRRWKAAVGRHGPDALRARRASGRPPKLSVQQHRRLERTLLAGAQAAGFESDLWTCPRVAQLIRQRFGIGYHVDHLGRLLRSLGWSPQRPERRARERDEVQIRRWIQGPWPRIKKKPAG